MYRATVKNDGKIVRVEKIGGKDQQGGEWHKDVAEKLNNQDAENRVTFSSVGRFAFDAYDHVPWKLIPNGKSNKCRVNAIVLAKLQLFFI